MRCLVGFFLACLVCANLPLLAQDVDVIQYPGYIYSYPAANIPASAKTYSVKWENNGNASNEVVDFADLTHTGLNPDLEVYINIGNIVSERPTLMLNRFTRNEFGGVSRYMYHLKGDFSIKVLAKNKVVLYSKSWTSLNYYTDWYNSDTELKANNPHLKIPNDFAYLKVKEFLQEKLKNDFKPRKFKANFSVSVYKGSDAEFNWLIPATKSFYKALKKLDRSSLTPPSANAELTKAMHSLKKELVKVDWDALGVKFNRKVGNSILEALFAGAINTGDYKTAAEISARYLAINNGLFADYLTVVTTDPEYPGTTLEGVMNDKNPRRVWASDLLDEFMPNYLLTNNK